MMKSISTMNISFFFLRGVASFVNKIYKVIRRWLIWTIAAAPIPKHVAIIMDGSRRYAAAQRQRDNRSGHESGFKTLVQTLPFWYELGVKCVSVYAFSIENFKRSDEEVTALMNVLHDKFQKLAESSVVTKYGVRLQILGELSLLPERVSRAAEEAMAATKGNDKAVLNIFAPYTSTREIVRAVEDVCHEAITHEQRTAVYRKHDEDAGAVGEEIESSIRVEDIERHLYTARNSCGEVQLLIRTSGETRLSNFLLWQSSFAFLYVTPVLWPQFTFRHILMAILEYQKAYPSLHKKKRQLRSLVSHAN